MTHTAVLIPGDGIGLEVSAAVREILAAAHAPVEFVEHLAGEVALEHGKKELAAGRDARRHPHAQGRAQGPVHDADRQAGSARSTSRCARSSTCSPPCARCATCRACKTRYENVDMVIVRENTEGLYSGLENAITEDVVVVDEGRDASPRARASPSGPFAMPIERAAQARDRAAQGEHHEAHRRDVPDRGAQGAHRAIRRSNTTS